MYPISKFTAYFQYSELCLNTWLPVCLSAECPECPAFSPDLQWLKLEVLRTHQNREARPTVAGFAKDLV